MFWASWKDSLQLVAVARERDRLREGEVEAEERQHDRDQADLEVREGVACRSVDSITAP